MYVSVQLKNGEAARTARKRIERLYVEGNCIVMNENIYGSWSGQVPFLEKLSIHTYAEKLLAYYFLSHVNRDLQYAVLRIPIAYGLYKAWNSLTLTPHIVLRHNLVAAIMLTTISGVVFVWIQADLALNLNNVKI